MDFLLYILKTILEHLIDHAPHLLVDVLKDDPATRSFVLRAALFVMGRSSGRFAFLVVTVAPFGLWCYATWPQSLAPKVKVFWTTIAASLAGLVVYFGLVALNSFVTDNRYLGPEKADANTTASNEKADANATVSNVPVNRIDDLFERQFLFTRLQEKLPIHLINAPTDVHQVSAALNVDPLAYSASVGFRIPPDFRPTDQVIVSLASEVERVLAWSMFALPHRVGTPEQSKFAIQVFVYFDHSLSESQKADLVDLYRAKGYLLQLRGSDYLEEIQQRNTIKTPSAQP